MNTTTTNPLETCEVPEGFIRAEARGLGPTLECKTTGTTINWSRHFERLSNGKATGPFHVQNYRRGRLNCWAATLEEAVSLAAK